jgi:hypothetical protein
MGMEREEQGQLEACGVLEAEAEPKTAVQTYAYAPHLDPSTIFGAL